MQFRTRVATLIVRDNHLLLVKMVDPDSGFTWWIPPGGRLEADDGSILECAVREVREETGLTVEVSRIVYVGEFVDLPADTHYLELFLWADSNGGEPSLSHIRADELEVEYIKDVTWMTAAECAREQIFPEILRDQFWVDLASGLPTSRYIGRRSTAGRPV